MPSAIISEIGFTQDIRHSTMIVTSIISYSMTIISLFITLFIYGRFIFGKQQIKGFTKFQIELEKRLLAVILFSNITGFFYLTVKYTDLLYDYKMFPTTFKDVALFCYAIGNLFYIVNHYGELILLSFMSRELQKSFFSFYLPCLWKKLVEHQTKIIKSSTIDPKKTITVFVHQSK